MFGVLLSMFSMVSLGCSVPLSDSLSLALSIDGGDIVNIIKWAKCFVAGRGAYGG